MSEVPLCPPLCRCNMAVATEFHIWKLVYLILIYVVYLVIYNSGWVTPRHLLVVCDLSRSLSKVGINQVYHTNAFIFLVKIILCSNLHRANVSNQTSFSME